MVVLLVVIDRDVRQTVRRFQGLRFRSTSEMKIAQALDRYGVLYLPNCKGRLGRPEERMNREADFFVILNGKVGILEVDGEPFHPPTRTVRDRHVTRAGSLRPCARSCRC
jgi:hypothetical protein